ncbi:Di-copper centre-containing protein [Polyplosphaeria fusca]|uniref:tyrosinase n=1 Tax=Polyplosphaeria fusca TaxID=682080 RepID=A0A9P4QYU9_9PLEO|nr:Di-copper centre-containing protein [Polyplosphaeria fusca]
MATTILSRAFKLLSLIQLLSTLVACTPLVLTEDGAFEYNASPLQPRQSGFFSVLGTPGDGTTSVQPRLEIRQLQQNADQWNIYLLGLRKFQNMTQSDRSSWYQVAGIHGRPYIAWDSVQAASGGSGGYCTHGSNIFPTWHRPYIALFEQILYQSIQAAVAEFPAGSAQRNRYNTALATFRIPYWDWAAIPPSGQSSFPAVLQQPTISVVLPNGTTTINNPLFSYVFHPLSASDMGNVVPWSVYPSTLRSPSTRTAKAVSQNSKVASGLDQNRPNIQSRVYNVLALQNDYDDISNDQTDGDSLESTHDTIHTLVGAGNGHMGQVPYAAFDPAFMLHHANVDRMFAIWQALNPNSYVSPASNPYATFWSRAGATADTNTPLKPFHKDSAGNFWTSTTVRSTSTFGYTYPELVNSNTTSLIATINALYGPNATAPSQRTRRSDPLLSPRRLRNVAGAPLFSAQRQYIANMRVQRFGLDGSFNIYVFLGAAPDSDPSTWADSASFVGLTGIFTATSSVQSEDVKASATAHGAVELTAALEAKVKSGEACGMGEKCVGAYLKEKLHWRVSKLDGTAIDVENTPGFEISVVWAKIRPAKNQYEFPKRVGGYQTLIEATEGQAGGLS